MTACLVLLPLLAVVLILMGYNPRRTTRITTALMLLAGIFLAALWAMDIRDGLSIAPVVLAKPEIRLGLDLYDGMSVIMMLLSVIVAFAASRSGDYEDRHSRLGSQLNLLEHARLQNLWCHAQAGGTGLGLLLSEAAAERR